MKEEDEKIHYNCSLHHHHHITQVSQVRLGMSVDPTLKRASSTFLFLMNANWEAKPNFPPTRSNFHQERKHPIWDNFLFPGSLMTSNCSEMTQDFHNLQ
ncbi:hypothetical protein HanRHA438_Chr13g0621271 [Helianthus annuus]|nr:hypothetical protein HanRHA438_Chr13g0621271 [Helianthus annuus]